MPRVVGDRTELVLVIDTTAYAGNFEREIAAYCTGAVGESSKGRRERADFLDEVADTNPALAQSLVGMVALRPTERGHMKAGHIRPTPGRVNDGRGNHLDEAGFDPGTGYGGIAHPCYESVAIHIERAPTAEEISLVRERAAAFAARGAGSPVTGHAPFGIRAVRVVERRTTVTETDLPT